MPKKKKITPNPSGSQLHAQRISELMMEKKALDIKIIDVRNITTLTDFFVICTSESEPQSRAITDHVNLTMKTEGHASWHTEGYQYLNWVLIDYVNVVVNIFNNEARDFYAVERLWADAKIETIN